ncbi:MAG: sulfite oxidase-like oxidoreductase, partial [Cytophagales bacterium]|nr:sulfite oxidase-like oxidoreductase [Armatimonadota bacterium]
MLFGTRDPNLQGDVPPGPDDAPVNAIVSPDTRRGGIAERTPPHQSRTKKWPVLDAGGPPQRLDLKDWRFSLTGLVEESVTFTWDEFRKLPRTKVFADMHCVTRWSRLGNVWEGVSTRDLLRHVTLKPGVQFVLISAYDKGFSFRGGATDWTTNLPLEAFTEEDCLFADTHDGQAIPLEHGGPLRLVIPRLYAWKSAKWVKGIEFRDTDTPGFWERGGYHMLGDPWKEQRYRFEGEEDSESA